MSFFISDAIATTDVLFQSANYSLVIMLFLFILAFYFMILRPQKKQAQAHQELIKSINKGDEIMTTSGFIGRVITVKDTGYIYIALNDTNEVIIKQDFVASVLPKGTIKAL